MTVRVLAFRNAAWLPKPPPPQLVSYVEITEDNGTCCATNIYSTGWSDKRISEPYRDLMEWQIVIELAGGIAEAVHRGERRPHAILAHAASHCSTATDLTRAAAVLADLSRLTAHRHDAQHSADRAL